MTTSPGLWLAAIAFGLGLLVGSFLNVVIARVPVGKSIVRPGSHCPRCGHAIAWFENVPLVSWAILGGRCRACRAPISLRYPAVELLTGCLFLACWVRFGPSWALLRGLLLVCFLVPLAFIDLDQWILPFELTLPGIATGLLSSGLLGREEVRDSLLGAVAGFLFLWSLEWLSPWIVHSVRWTVAQVRRPVLWVLRRTAAGDAPEGAPAETPEEVEEGVGGGDKWLLALLGAYLGWQSLFGLVLLSTIQGAVVGTALLLLRGRAGPPLLPAAPAPEPPVEPVPAGPAPEEPTSAEPGAPPPDAAVPVAEDDWRPGRTHLPYGPWLALAGLEILLLGPFLHRVLPFALASLLTGGRGE